MGEIDGVLDPWDAKEVGIILFTGSSRLPASSEKPLTGLENRGILIPMSFVIGRVQGLRH